MHGISSLYGFNLDNQFGSSSFQYDGNGNPFDYLSSSQNFYFDAENRLTAITSQNYTAEYDAFGLRIKKNNYYNYLYDGDTPIVEQIKYSTDYADTVVHAYGPTGQMTLYTGSAFHDFTYDPEGNYLQCSVSNSSNAVRDTALYEAYGNPLGDMLSSTGNTINHDAIGFGAQYGYYNDNETGLVLLGHRYYDPRTGRFITRDPIGYNGGINLYAYAGGNPVNNSDPSGFNPLDKTQAWINRKVDRFTVWLGKKILSGLSYGFKYDHSKQPTFADANPENPSAVAIKQGGQYLNNHFIPYAVGGAAIAVVSSRLGKKTESSFDLSPEHAMQAGMDRIIATGGEEVVSGFKVFGAEGMTGITYIRSIYRLSAVEKGKTTLGSLFRAFEAEAKARGAEKVMIVGHAISPDYS